MSGPDVGEQVKLLHLAQGQAPTVMTLESRMQSLRAHLASAPAAAEKVAG